MGFTIQTPHPPFERDERSDRTQNGQMSIWGSTNAHKL